MTSCWQQVLLFSGESTDQISAV